jgi:hypothetical protein
MGKGSERIRLNARGCKRVGLRTGAEQEVASPEAAAADAQTGTFELTALTLESAGDDWHSAYQRPA